MSFARRPAALVSAALAAAVLLATVLLQIGSPASASTSLSLGAYYAAGSAGTTGLTSFETWTGAPLPYALDFAPDATWDDLTGQNWQLDPWATSNRRLVFSLPPFPAGQGSLSQCSTGAYNSTWRTLAGHLVAKGLDDTVVRPGWEFNGGWFGWAAAADPSAFAGCFRQIVTTMRSVTGQHFSFNWNPNIGPGDFAAELAYPGDAYVDSIGIDVYDQSWLSGTYPIPAGATTTQIQAARSKVWDYTVNGDHGLVWWRNFASAHGKSLSLPEWGLLVRPDGHGGGDDPYFMQQLLNWVRTPANLITYAMYFEHDNGGYYSRLSSSDTRFPAAAKTWRTTLTTATPTASPTSSPTTSPTATPTVSPVATPTVTPTATPTATPTSAPTGPTTTASNAQWSSSSKRNPAAALSGAAFGGSVAVWEPSTSVSAVAFYLDDPSRSRAPLRVDTAAPFDLAGGNAGQATLYNTAPLSPGTHTLTTLTTLTSGSQTVATATFTVSATAVGTPVHHSCKC